MTDAINAVTDGTSEFWVGDWLVEPALNRISRGHRDERVEPKVMQVLVCMAQQPGKPITKDAFMTQVWDGNVVTDDVLARCIYSLRKVFGDDPRDPHVIETIRKTGYRLIAPVTPGRAGDTSFPGSSTGDAGRSSGGDGFAHLAVPAGTISHRTFARPSYPLLAMVVVAVLGAVFGGYFALRTAGDVAAPPLPSAPLTSFPGVESDPALSPDGKRVAFAWDGGLGGDTDIFVKQIGAEALLRLSAHPGEERHPVWSPDGQHLAFVRAAGGNYAVFVVPSLGGSERQVVSFGAREVGGLAWSPDENNPVLAVSVRTAPHEPFALHTVMPDGTGLQQITGGHPYPDGKAHVGDVAPAFSPDGKTLAYIHRVSDDVGQIYVVSVKGGTPRRLSDEVADFDGVAWDANGRSLVVAAYREGTSGLWRLPAEGGSLRWIMTGGEGARLRHPSAAAGRLAYALQFFDTNIWQFNRTADQRNYRERRLVFSTRWDSNPDLAPDGTRIAFVSMRSGHPEVWVGNRDGEDLVQLTTFGGAETSTPRWSPGGDSLVFAVRQGGGSALFIADGAGGGLRQLTQAPGDDVLPVWSRDGRWIYFASDRTGNWQIWKVPVAGGEPVRVTVAGGRAAAEGPDGETLYFVKPDTAGIWAMPVTGGQERQVVPDLEPADWGNWRVTYDGIYYLRRVRGAAELVLHRFDSGRTTVIARLGPVPFHPSLAVTPDGRDYLYTRIDRNESDVMMIEAAQ